MSPQDVALPDLPAQPMESLVEHIARHALPVELYGPPDHRGLIRVSRESVCQNATALKAQLTQGHEYQAGFSQLLCDLGRLSTVRAISLLSLPETPAVPESIAFQVLIPTFPDSGASTADQDAVLEAEKGFRDLFKATKRTIRYRLELVDIRQDEPVSEVALRIADRLAREGWHLHRVVKFES